MIFYALSKEKEKRLKKQKKKTKSQCQDKVHCTPTPYLSGLGCFELRVINSLSYLMLIKGCKPMVGMVTLGLGNCIEAHDKLIPVGLSQSSSYCVHSW